MPGMCMHAAATTTSTQEAMEILAKANTRTLSELRIALAPRDRDNLAGNADVRTLADMANQKGFEASTAYDMVFMQNAFFGKLREGLQGRYATGYRAIAWAEDFAAQYRATRNEVYEPDLFTLCLAAVVDMSGPEDES